MENAQALPDTILATRHWKKSVDTNPFLHAPLYCLEWTWMWCPELQCPSWNYDVTNEEESRPNRYRGDGNLHRAGYLLALARPGWVGAPATAYLIFPFWEGDQLKKHAQAELQPSCYSTVLRATTCFYHRLEFEPPIALSHPSMLSPSSSHYSQDPPCFRSLTSQGWPHSVTTSLRHSANLLATLLSVAATCLTWSCSDRAEITPRERKGWRAQEEPISFLSSLHSDQNEVFHWLSQASIMFMNSYILRGTGRTLAKGPSFSATYSILCNKQKSAEPSIRNLLGSFFQKHPTFLGSIHTNKIKN